MARRTANSLLNSLKSKIWLATSALAFFICSFGLVAYLIVFALFDDTFYAVFTLFLLMAFSVMVFGWWLSNEIISPIEKVSLLAKSMERGVSITLPRTTGSIETDELLLSLQRNNQQVQNLVGLMNKVASGDLDVALSPLQNSDRLSNSFQKLLAKVSESIHAKQDLEKLKNALEQINEEIISVRSGNFNAEITADSAEIREISETLRYLIQTVNKLIGQIETDSVRARSSAVEAQKTLQIFIQQDELSVQELNQAKLALKQTPGNVQKISETLAGSALSAVQSIEKAQKGTQTAQENLSSVAALRRQIQEAVSRIGRLNERSLEIGKVAKAVDDLAQRTGLIALNASIQADELGAAGGGFASVAEEIEHLAARAGDTNKQISSLNKTIFAEIAQVESSLDATVGEVANLSKYAIETGNALSELERYVGQFLNLQDQLAGFSSEQSAETEQAFQVFINSISETERKIESLKKTEDDIIRSAKAMDNLQSAIAGFKSPPDKTDSPETAAGLPDFSQTAEQNIPA